MSNPDPGPDAHDDIGMPLWLKVLGAVSIVVIVLVVAMMLGGHWGGHGPGRHFG
jgi:hypothetical protein